MRVNVYFEFLFVGKNEDAFVKNYFYELDEEERGEEAVKGGKLFMNFEMMNNLALGEDVGEFLFQTVKKCFFKKLEEDPYVRFEEALKVVNQEIAVMQQEKQFKFISNINVVLGAIVGDELFISQAGESEAYLIRRKHVSIISEGLSEGERSHSEVFLNIANGTLEKGDVVIFSSNKLLRFISKSELGSISTESTITRSLQKLKDFLKSEIQNKTVIFGIRIEGMSEVQGSSAKEKQFKLPSIPLLNKEKAFSYVKKFTFFFSYISVVSRYFRKFSGMGKKHILIVIFLCFFILAVGVIAVKKRNDEQKKIASLEQILVDAQEDMNIAETKGNFDKATAGIKLEEARTKALEVVDSGVHYNKARQLLDKIEELRNSLDGIVKMKEGVDYTVFADLSQKRSNVDSLGIMKAKDSLYVYEYNALYRIVLHSIEDPLTIDENESVVTGSYFEDRDSLLFLTKSNRVIEYKDGQFVFMDTEDGNWHGGVGIQGYSNKVYILSPIENQIWRYVRRRDNYSGSESYNRNADLQGTVSMAIDGNVYALKSTGEIIKLYTGEKQNYRIMKEPLVPMTAPVKIFTELDMSQIYVMEPLNKRVLIYNKDSQSGNLVYSGQYIFDDIPEMKDFFVDKVSNKLYLLDKTKVYEAKL
ncbi:hypothetical protein HYV57_04815 [Candidatus Peregrinibacteria bacterium]|nr:hypothetical protein [Candidatus Peregrinibacteria bacterium]